MLRVRADCGGRLFTAKLAVVAHNLAHQLLNHLPPDDAILLARQFCDGLRDSVDHFVGFVGSSSSEPAYFLNRGPKSLSMSEVEVGLTPGRMTVARSTEAHASSVRSVISGSVGGTVGRCHGLRMRSLKPHPVAVSNRPTVTPLSRAQLLHQVQLDASVTIRPSIPTAVQQVSPI